MHPDLFRIPLPWGGGLTIHSYGFMIMLGFLCCLYLLGRRGRRLGFDTEALYDTALVVLLGGIVCSRLYFVISNWRFFRSDPVQIIRIDRGGLVFYGGVMGGAAALLVMIYRKGFPVRRTLDLVAGLVPLGHAFGRVGCFLNGCCFGRVTNSFVGVKFPRILADGVSPDPALNVGGKAIVGCPVFVHQVLNGQVANTSLWSQPVHPTQLYAVGYNLLIFAFLSFWYPRRWRDGEVAWLYGILYGSARFINEMFRDDQPRLLWGLTVAQMICLCLVVFGVVMFLLGRRKPRQPLPEPAHGFPHGPDKGGKAS